LLSRFDFVSQREEWLPGAGHIHRIDRDTIKPALPRS
jgi:hypothetical protein